MRSTSINTVLYSCVLLSGRYWSTIIQNGSFVMSHSLSLSEFVIDNLKSPQHTHLIDTLLPRDLLALKHLLYAPDRIQRPAQQSHFCLHCNSQNNLNLTTSSIIVHHYRLLQVYLSDDDFKAYKQDRFIARLV